LRFLFLIIAIWLGVMILRHFYRNKMADKVKPALKTESMVRCEHCGTHTPEAEAIQYGEKWFCSSHHLKAFKNEHE